MAISFLAALTKTARIAYPIVKRGVREGLSGRAIGQILKNSNLGIRTQTLFEIIRREKRIQSKGAQLRFLRLASMPNPDRLPKALTVIRRRYAFILEVAGTISQTGESFLRHITVSTDTLMTRQQLEDVGRMILEDDPSAYPLEIDKVTLNSGVQQGELGRLIQ